MNRPLVIVMFSDVALDERNGGGVRTVIQYLRELPELSVLSVHLGSTGLSGRHLLKSVEYELWQRRAFPKNILPWLCALRSIRKRLNDPMFLLYPNATLQDLQLCALAASVSKRTLTWFMDDFISAMRTSSRSRQALARWAFRHLYRRSAVRVAISNAMADEYGLRYGKPVDLVLGKRFRHAEMDGSTHRTREDRARGPIRLVWVGKYQHYYREPLVAIAEILRQSPALNIELDIWGQDAPTDPVAVPGRVRYRGAFESHDLLEILRDYDYGLSAYSFDAFTTSFMRLSFAGKLIDYLAAGIPIISIAPWGLSQTRELQVRDVGLCLETRDPAPLRSLIEGLRSIPEDTYQRWRQNSIQWGRTEFVFEDGLKALRRSVKSISG